MQDVFGLERKHLDNGLFVIDAERSVLELRITVSGDRLPPGEVQAVFLREGVDEFIELGPQVLALFVVDVNAELADLHEGGKVGPGAQDLGDHVVVCRLLDGGVFLTREAEVFQG